MGGIAIFMLVTAVVVMIPVVLQVRQRETRFGEVWGFMVFALGLVVVGLSDTTVGRPWSTPLLVAGLLLALFGLIGQARRRPSTDDHSANA
jgi:UDP-N-acetylmuramyl pentapeptide phosphotransferase/UDP-N-acetylglucosamine-1-phosphate transferase